MRVNSLRLVVAVLVLAMVLALGSNVTSQAQEEEKVYKVSSDIAWPPFEWVDEAGNYVGFDLDLIRSIALIQGFEIEIIDMTFDAIIPAVQACKSDIGVSGFTITAEREEVVDFSFGYWVADQAVLARIDSGFATLDAVFRGGHIIGAQRGTTGSWWVEDRIAEGVDIELRVYDTYPETVLDLSLGRLDAVVQDEPASTISLGQYPEELMVVDIIRTREIFGFLVKEGDPDGLLPLINEGLVKLQMTGVYYDLVQAYFGTDLDRITDAYAKSRHFLEVEKDPAAYAESLKRYMMSE